jgi:hypothetical protein
MPHHRKYRRLSDAALGLWVRGSCYANEYLTDGRLDDDFVETELVTRSRKQLASELVERGLWHQDGGEYVIHDHLDYNPSREQVEVRKENRAAAGRLGGSHSPNGKQT